MPTASVLSDEMGDEETTATKRQVSGERKDILRFLCLRPNFTLRKQMMLSFGSVNLITILVVVLVCVFLTLLAGNNVKEASTETIEELVQTSLAFQARYLAESLTESIVLFDVVKFLYEATRDRFEGHPSFGDEHVPFYDIDSGSNRYPVRGPEMPIEWNVSPNVDESNYEEYLQSRWEVFKNTPIDTKQTGFIMQGACDPLETNPEADAYWPNCTEANNNILTGGVISPSNQTELYYRKGGDLAPTLRALFEQWEVVRDLGLYFMNQGAGASVNYPHYSVSTQSTYTSIGCDWLLSPNPYDPTRTIGTDDMLTNCRPEGDVVSSRLYNPMERGFCREQALEPDRIFASTFENAWNPGEWLLVLGRGVYDRMTKEFVGCMYIGVNLQIISDILEASRTTKKAEATVVQYGKDGFIVASSKNLTAQLPVSEAGLGLTIESYEDLLSLVDFNSVWDPDEARDAYSDFSAAEDDFYVAVHPIPPVPDEFDPEYEPLFFVVNSLHLDDYYAAINLLHGTIDERVKNIITFASICGVMGLVLSTAVLYGMARMLTAPLTNMNKVANEIVGSFGDSKKEDEIRQIGDVSVDTKCSPRTELSDVVGEFNKMVTNFSGASEAKSEKFKDDDMENIFPARKDLFPIYEKRADGLFMYNATGEHLNCATIEKSDVSSSTELSIEYLHFGPNHISAMTSLTTPMDGDISVNSSSSLKKCSGLFLWIVLLIATPLLFITILVSAGVITTINLEFARSTQDIQAEYLVLQEASLLAFTRLRAGFVSSFSERATNDAALYARYASWLLFGALSRSDTFSEMTTGIEECKAYSDDFSQCPYVVENDVCDCAWREGGSNETCTFFPDESSSRRLQKLYWISEVSDAPNGDRFATTFPNEFNETETTLWWDELTALPGFEVAGNTSGFDTSYDRMRVISAVPVTLPIFNYGLGTGEESYTGLGVGFEADGAFVFYEGCSNAYHVSLASWSSTVTNRASELRPELCPLGKFGYDPRCRGWYHTGREQYLADRTQLHITAPYLFAQTVSNGDIHAQSATIALVDPRTSEHVGQTVLDFIASPIYRTLEKNTYVGSEGFPVLITVDGGNTPETIIGPGVSLRQDSLAIAKVCLPYDHKCTNIKDCRERIKQFESIVLSMKSGESAETTFIRKTRDGSLETMHIAYSPVYVSSVEPVDSSDYSRGVRQVRQLVYSLALVETEGEMLLPFQEIEDTTEKQTMDPPKLREINASYEIVAFSNTLEALFRIVRSANVAFFNGELDFAYRVLKDALRLFRRLDNKKAIGIASNNLGNMLLAIYREMTAAKLDKLYGLTRDDIVKQGILYFHDAIQLGEKSYDEFYEKQGWSPSCLNFMQHLANRYFNRGLFLLHAKGDHKCPNEIEELGMRDIQIACDMDHEVVAYGEEIGWGSADRAEKRFNVNVGRIRGFNILYELGYDHDWGVEDLISETVDIIRTEYKNYDTEFFSSMSLGGRLQELELQLMRYHSNHGDLETAAKIAVRMIIEDERVFTESIRMALDVLINYAESKLVDAKFRSKIVPVLRAYRKNVSEFISGKRQRVKDDMDSASASLTKSLTTSAMLQTQLECSERSALSNAAGEESSRFVTMEDF
ncbi:MAG: hypothetical protein SGILL_001036 [Bacillariaceae sp.]